MARTNQAVVAITFLLLLMVGCNPSGTRKIPPPIDSTKIITRDTIPPPTVVKVDSALLIRQQLKRLESLISLPVDTSTTSIRVDQLNTLLNGNQLQRISIRLFELMMADSARVLNIVHIGDSHVQGNYLPNTIRAELQRVFGNAGSGYMLGFSYEKKRGRRSRKGTPIQYQARAPLTKDLIISSSPNGLGGVYAEPVSNQFELTVPKSRLHWQTDAKPVIEFYCDSGRFAFTAVYADSLKGDSVAYLPVYGRNHPAMETVSLPNQRIPDRIIINRIDTLAPKPRWFGWSFHSGTKGLMYHAIGLNGASYATYNENLSLLQQMSMLIPDLIIISLGTNDGYGNSFDNIRFRTEVTTFIAALRALPTHPEVLITTPPDAAKGRGKRRKPAVYVAAAATELRQIADREYLVCWDLFRQMGGSGAIIKWKSAMLARDDYVHFTPAGYELIGRSFAQAFLHTVYTNVSTHP